MSDEAEAEREERNQSEPVHYLTSDDVRTYSLNEFGVG